MKGICRVAAGNGRLPIAASAARTASGTVRASSADVEPLDKEKNFIYLYPDVLTAWAVEMA